MGVSTDFYQEMDYWAGQNGISSDNMTKALERLNQRMGRAADGNEKYSSALEALGIDMNEVRDGTLSTEDAMAQSIQSLSEMESEQQKSAIASELFGTKLSRNLMPALQDGSLSMEEARKKAEELGIVISEDQLSAAEEFQDAQDDIKRSLSMVGAQIGLELMPRFQSMMDWTLAHIPQIKDTISNAFDTVSNSIKDAVDWFRELSPQTKKAIGLTAGMAAALGPVSIAIGTVMKIFGPFIGIIGKGLTVVGKFGGLLPLLKAGFAALTGPIGITVAAITALTTGFTLAYKKSDTFRGWIDKLKNAFLGLVPPIKKAIGFVVDFFRDKISEMTSFWDSEGSQFLDAFSNVFGGIWKVTKPVLDGILAAVKFTLPIIKGIFDLTFLAVLEIVKMVWKNIQGVIDGGLKIIMGLIKTFSGLFTDDFSKMWEGIKDIFSGAIQFLWNFVQLSFFGKLLKGLTGFAKLFGNMFSKMWTGIRGIFTNVIKFLVEFVKNSFTTMKNKTTSIFTGIRDMTKSVWNKTKDFIVNPIKSGVNWAIKKFTGFKNSVTTTFKNIKDNVFGYVSDMIQKVKDMPGNMKKGIIDGASKVKEGMLSIGRKMVDGIK